MRYLTKNADGSVAVIVVVPIAVTDHATGERHDIIGVRTDDVLPGVGVRAVYGPFGRLVIGNDQYDIGDLRPDSLAGFTFHFPDVQKDIIGKWVPASKDAVVGVREIAKSELITDRTFRDAWSDDATGLHVDMVKARELHRDHMRVARKQAFKALDAEVSKSLALDDKQAAQDAEAKRQELRDVTDMAEIEAATTPEQLKAVWPALLGPMVRPQRPDISRL